MFISFATQPLIRVRAPLADDGQHNFLPNWAAAAEETLTGWTVQPGVTDELVAGRDATLIQWTAIGPGGADVLSTDRIKHQGVTYEVDGEPARWPSPTGALDNTLLLLKKWKG